MYLQRTSVNIMSFFIKDFFGFFSQVMLILETLNAQNLVIVTPVMTLALYTTILSNFAKRAGFQFLIFLHQFLTVKFTTEAMSLIFEAHSFVILNFPLQLKKCKILVSLIIENVLLARHKYLSKNYDNISF